MDPTVPLPPSPPPLVTQIAPAPPGVLPRRGQMWLMVAVAGGMLAIILFTGHAPAPPTAKPVQPSRTTPLEPNPEQLRNYQQRLAERARQEQPHALDARPGGRSDDRPDDLRPVPLDRDSRGIAAGRGSSTPPKPADAIAEERAKREYESLFASNVVRSANPTLAPPSPKTPAATSRTPAPVGGSSLEDITAAVLRQSGLPLASAAPPAAPATAVPGAAPTSVAAPVARPAVVETTPGDGPLHRVLQGTFIDGVLVNRLDGATAAPVTVLVSSVVYAADGTTIVIPAGSRVLGTTKPVQSFGETKLAIAFDRLLLPSGRSYALQSGTGLDAAGDAGVRDGVDNHYAAIFGASAAVGLISGLAQYLTGSAFGTTTSSGPVIVTGAVGTGAAQATSQTMGHFLNRLPTLTIREGHRMKVYLTQDLQLPEYQAAGAGRRDPGLRLARQGQP